MTVRALASSRAEVQLGLADLAVAADLADQLGEVVDEHLVAADEAEGVRRRGGLEHVVVGVDDDRARAEHGEHRGHTGRHERLLDVGQAGLLAIADVPGEHAAAGDDCSDDGRERCLRRRVHTTDRTQRDRWRSPTGRRARSVHASFTSDGPDGPFGRS